MATPTLPAAAAPAAARPAKPPHSALSALVQQAQAYVEPLLRAGLDPRLAYHTLAHTAYVVKQAHALADAAALPPPQAEELLLAAWFHDSGYLDTYDGHEYRSMERAAAWLREQGVAPARIELIENLIRATHRDEPATTELEKLMGDADMSNLAADDFRGRAELIRAEWELALDKSYSDVEWAELQLDFMLAHHYRSEAGKARYKRPSKPILRSSAACLRRRSRRRKRRTKRPPTPLPSPSGASKRCSAPCIPTI